VVEHEPDDWQQSDRQPNRTFVAQAGKCDNSTRILTVGGPELEAMQSFVREGDTVFCLLDGPAGPQP
jgi:hypothetical protein